MMSTGDVHAWRTVQAFFSQVPASLSRTASCTSGVWTAGLGRWGGACGEDSQAEESEPPARGPAREPCSGPAQPGGPTVLRSVPICRTGPPALPWLAVWGV